MQQRGFQNEDTSKIKQIQTILFYEFYMEHNAMTTDININQVLGMIMINQRTA